MYFCKFAWEYQVTGFSKFTWEYIVIGFSKFKVICRESKGYG